MEDIIKQMIANGDITQDVAEKYFPELKESEGERTRKNIIKAFKIFEDKQAWVGHCLDDIDWDACIAWVEKQGEKKPTDLRTWKYIVDAVLTEREGIGQYLDSPWTTEVAEKLQKRFGNCGQKPTEAKDLRTWKYLIEDINGEDYGIDSLWHAIRILEKTLGAVEGYQTDDGLLEHKAAITEVKKLYKQKSAECGEENEDGMGKNYT